MNHWLPALIPLTSLFAGVAIFALGERRRGWRILLNLASAVLKIALVGLLVWGVYNRQHYEFRLPLFLGFDMVLHADPLSLLFVSLSAILWLVTTVYAIGYLDMAQGRDRARFFGFFSLCVSATTGIALAGNLFTYFIFYELLTITTYPLVTHRGNRDSLRAGRIYLAYTLIGGALLLGAIIWLKSIVGAIDFTRHTSMAGFSFVDRNVLSDFVQPNRVALTIIFAMLVAGFGVKAAIIPLHGWLPIAMIAPAPVSALLHAVAVVKAGAFGIVRVVYDVYGADVCTALGVRPFLAAMAAATIIYASIRALGQDDIKRRLAYSTVSQLSYIALGAAIPGSLATIGGIVHLVHQGIMKITMFFCAGNLAEELHIKNVSALNGVGRRMPWTMGAFSVACLAMIGVPPLAGFVSKWYLARGALEAGWHWVVPVLLGSSALNAAYFLPIIYRAWFLEPEREWEPLPGARRVEIGLTLLLPPIFTAACVILAGLCAGMSFSPLQWARLIATREYGL